MSNAVLHVADVHKSFGGLKALSDIDLQVMEGTTHAIIGPNGAGKSTLLNVCIGRIPPDTGAVVFDGQVISEKLPYEINQMGVVRVFQTPEIFPDLTLLQNVMVPAFAKRDGAFRLNAFTALASEATIRGEAEHWLEDMGLADQKDVLAASLSRGDKRRLELAMGLVQHPRLLLLDEPTAGMSRADTNATIELMKRIAESGVTMVVIEHDMHVVFSLAEKISVLAQGTVIAEDLPEKIKGNPKVQEAYLGGAHL